MKNYLAAVIVALLTACATTMAPYTFNDRAAIAMQSVTTLRQANTALLVAGKITVEQDKARQAALNEVRSAVELARVKFPTNADEATQMLVAALNKLAAEKAKQ